MIFKPNTTVATIVEQAGRYLLVEERIRGRHLLNQPAGHLEPNETLPQAAVRETLEETGCAVEIAALVGVYQWVAPDNQRQFLRFTFAGRLLSQDHDASLDRGIVRALWLDRQSISASALPLRSPVVMASIDHYEAGISHPLSLLHWIEA